MPELMALTCPVCGAPLSPGEAHCAFCGSAIYIKADAPELNLRNLNQSVIQEHIADFRARIRKDRYDVEAHYGLGMAYYSLGLPDEAIEELTHAAKLMPENADIQTQLAVVLHQQLLAGKAAAEGPMKERLAKALTLDPGNFEANLLRADILQRRGDYVGALGILRPVVAADPRRANIRRAEILAVLGRQALANDDPEGFGRVIAELREIGDDATVRELLLLSLRQHQDGIGPSVIVAPGGAGATMTEDLGDKAASIAKTILVAVGVLIVGFLVLMIVAVALPEDDQGSLSGASLAIFGIAFILWIASPFVAGFLYRRRIRTSVPAWDPSRGTRITREDVLAGRPGLDDLIAIERAATGAVLRQRPRPPDVALATGTPASTSARGEHWFDGNR